MERVEKYAAAALASACSAISSALKGQTNNTLNTEAFGIGQIVGAGVIAYAEAQRELLAAALSNGIDKHEAEATIKSGLQSGMRNPRNLPEASAMPVQSSTKKRTTAEYARDLYKDAVKISGTLVERYLREHRGITGPLPASFRFASGVWHKGAGATLPAMVAPIVRTDETGTRIGAVHVTFLDPATGAKTKADPAKKMYGGCRHGAIWLGDYATHMLCAEGIEKGLACQAATGIPAAVGLSASLLPSIVWPRGTRTVTLCADPNGAGETAIHKAAKAMAADGIELLVCYPPLTAKDWDETPAADVKVAIAAAKPWGAPQGRPKRSAAIEALTAEDKRPLIQIAPGHLARIADEAEAHLIDARVAFYRRGNRLVRPVIDTLPAAGQQETKIPRLTFVDDTYMRVTLARHIRWEKFDKRSDDWVPADPSKDVAATLNANYGDWRFPTITGIVGTQTMRWDGTLLLKPGYDERTGLLLVDPPELPDMPDEPDRDDALDALVLLKELLTEFPFVGDGSLAVALSALITPVVRAACGAVPMHATTAPQAGTGKSYLFDISSAISLGQLCPVIAAGKSEDEMEKRLGAALMAGQPIISIDNVNGELGGELLCQAVERPLITPRILGKSEIGQVQNRASFFATGNNIVLLDDMTRRALICSLDSGEEKPELRRFRTRPAQTVLAERGPYIAACLTVARAYHLAGRPGCLPPLASFEQWSDTVRSALAWLGEDDPVATMEKARENDPARMTFAGFVHAWTREIGTGREHEMTAAELMRIAEENYAGVYRCKLLREALNEIAPQNRLNSRSLGRWLARHENKVSHGVKLRKQADSVHGHRWYLDDPAARLL